MDQESVFIVTLVMNGVEDIMTYLQDSVPDGDRDPDMDPVRLAKDVIYCCLALSRHDPLFASIPDFTFLLTRLKSGICASFFESIFDRAPAGTEYEYFSCIFQKEYEQVERELVTPIVKSIEEMEPSLILSREIVASWTRHGLAADYLKSGLLRRTEKLVKITLLRISKALLS